MGLIGKILGFLPVSKRWSNVVDVKINPGGGANITAEHFGPIGDDSAPLETDYVAVQPVKSPSGGYTVTGYLDPKNTPTAQPGEKRIYARKPADGSAVISLHLKADGSLVITNAAGDTVFNPDGSVVFANGAQIDAAGDVITATGISLNTHKHVGNLGSPTGPAIP